MNNRTAICNDTFEKIRSALMSEPILVEHVESFLGGVCSGAMRRMVSVTEWNALTIAALVGARVALDRLADELIPELGDIAAAVGSGVFDLRSSAADGEV